MPKQKKVIEVVCFYCKREFKYIVWSYYQINRAYCDECEKTYLDNRFQGGLNHRKYLEYLNQIRSQFSRSRKMVGVNEVNLYTKNGRLFKGEIDLGRIVASDEFFIYVQKYPFGTISSYQKEFIKEL